MAGWLALIVIASGCRPIQTRFELTTFSDPQAPQRLAENFEDGSFAINPRGMHEIVFERAPESLGTEDDQSDGAPTWASQTLRIDMMWIPKPGTTYAESSQTNANITYCVFTSKGAISYEGAGFVYFRTSRDGTRINGSIESSTLAPTRTAEAPDDVFGPCRLRGSFTAKRDKRRVVELQRRLRRVLGPPVTGR